MIRTCGPSHSDVHAGAFLWCGSDAIVTRATRACVVSDPIQARILNRYKDGWAGRVLRALGSSLCALGYCSSSYGPTRVKEDKQASLLVSTGYLWRSRSILAHRYTEYARLAAVHSYLAPDQ